MRPAEMAAAAATIVEAIRSIVEWLANDGAGPMPPSASIAALVAMLEIDRDARADLIAQAKASPELRSQIVALADAYESIYPSLAALSAEIEAE